MRKTFTQDEINHRKDVWQAILYQMKTHKVTPKELAYQTGYQQQLIERGIGGEPELITSAFRRACVRVFCLVDGRAEPHRDTIGMLSDDGLEALLKPPPEMPPRQGNFWEWNA